MAVRGQGVVGAVDHQEEGRRVDEHPLAAPRWGDLIAVAPCPATVVPMAAVPPTPNQGVMAAVIANDARHGMEAGNRHEVVTDPVTASLSVPVIDPVIGSQSALAVVSVSALVIDPENASVIVRKSGSATVPVPSTEIRMPPVQTLRTNALGLDVFAIATHVMATAVVQAMNDANRPSAPDPATTRAVPSARIQHRRPQRPHPRRTI